MSITLVIIIVTGLVSYQAFNDGSFKQKLLHYPYVEHQNKDYARLLTYGFIHANWTHLLINMYVLYIFGEYVEFTFVREFGAMKGRLFYISLYLLSIVAAAIPTHFKHKNNNYYAALGASGATSAILFAFIIFRPWSTLYLFFIIPCPAIVTAILYLAYSSWASKNANDNIGHDAHFYGAVFGFLFTIALNPSFFNRFLTLIVDDSPFW
ncbi:MAG: rhomboid family intramembrane serine protease [Bacteroidota bacterium]